MILIKLYNFVFLVYIKIDQENTMFFENHDESYTMTDVYLYVRFFGHKNFFYLKKVIMNILLDIMIQLIANKAN